MPADYNLDDDFELLLAWLGPDREQAGEKYEQLRQNLLDYFRRRGVPDPHSLADEVFVRVTKKAPEVAKGFVGDPAAYFLAVARLVLIEWWRQPARVRLPQDIPVPPTIETGTPKELLLQALDQCWARLEPHEQQIVLRYYATTEQKPRAYRARLAQELGITNGALRVLTHRLRGRLKRCIKQRLSAKKTETVTRIMHKESR
jgi:DNA-directed RNA polymerase specialized sigma24 family protein